MTNRTGMEKGIGAIFAGAGCIIAVSIIGTIIAIVVGAIFLVKGCNKVQDVGLKNAVNEVWEGPQTNSVSTNSIPE